MANLTRLVGDYFLKDQCQQLFAGTELCAKWYQVISGKPSSRATERVIDYASHAQEVFCWPLALSSLSSLVRRVTSKPASLKTLAVLSGTISLGSACGGIMIKNFFQQRTDQLPKLRMLGITADLLGEVIEIKKMTGKKITFLETSLKITRIAVSILSSSAAMAALYVPHDMLLIRVSLIIETILFAARFAENAVHKFLKDCLAYRSFESILFKIFRIV